MRTLKTCSSSSHPRQSSRSVETGAVLDVEDLAFGIEARLVEPGLLTQVDAEYLGFRRSRDADLVRTEVRELLDVVGNGLRSRRRGRQMRQGADRATLYQDRRRERSQHQEFLFGSIDQLYVGFADEVLPFVPAGVLQLLPNRSPWSGRRVSTVDRRPCGTSESVARSEGTTPVGAGGR